MALPDGASRPVVVITGSSRGLGRALALRCARAGWRVGVHYRVRRADAESAAALIAADHGECLVLQGDVTDPGTCPDMVDRTIARWGRIDAWINNAGVVDDRLLLAMPESLWDRMIATHLTAARRAILAVAPVMAARGGVIVNVVSLAALQGRRGQAHYAAAKAGLIALTRTAARELGADGIRVNAVCPPVLDTDAVGAHAASLRAQQAIDGAVPLDRAADTLFAAMTLPWMTGQTILLDSRIPEGAL